MPAFASKGHLIRSFNKLGDLLLTFGKQNKKPHAEQKATNDYEQAVLEPAYVQKPVNPPKPLQTTSKTPSPVTPLKVNWNTSKPNGLQVRDPRVFSAGKQMFDQLIYKGVEPDLTLTISRELLESGVTEPIAITMKSGDTLYKVVPKNSGKPSDNSPYFIDKKAFDSLPSDTNEIGNHLGLPQIPEEFDIYSITAKSESVIYQSEIAPFIVNNGEHIRSGGGVQTLVPDRSVFTSPKLVE